MSLHEYSTAHLKYSLHWHLYYSTRKCHSSEPTLFSAQISETVVFNSNICFDAVALASWVHQITIKALFLNRMRQLLPDIRSFSPESRLFYYFQISDGLLLTVRSVYTNSVVKIILLALSRTLLEFRSAIYLMIEIRTKSQYMCSTHFLVVEVNYIWKAIIIFFRSYSLY